MELTRLLHLQIIEHGFSVYYFLLTFLAGFISYFLIRPQINPKKYSAEQKIAHYGGLLYMIGGTIYFFIDKMLR